MLILKLILSWGGYLLALGSIIWILKLIRRKPVPFEFPEDGDYHIHTISTDDMGNRKVEFVPLEKHE